MKKIFLLLIITAGIITSATAQIGGVYNHQLNTYFDDACKKYNIKGASAAIYIPGDGMWQRTYGESHTNTPINSDMYFGIGSNTKTFTAVMMLKLQEQGKLDLDDTVGTWVIHPNIPGNITIRQLLNHTSGLYSFTFNTDINNFIKPPYTQIWTMDTVLSLVKPPVGPIGGSWDYSNTNYTVAGLIIRAVTGKEPYQVLRDEILTPNGLNETYSYPYEIPSGIIPHAWSAVLNTGNTMQDMIAVHNYSNKAFLSLANTAGCMMSTARDNATFWHKLVTGKLLNASSMAELETLVPINTSSSYGLGIFFLKNFNSRDVISHGGTGFGFINENLADKTSGVSISVLTNQDSISNSILLNVIIRALHQTSINHTNVENVNSNTLVSVYPNPAKNNINIKLDQNNAIANLYDVTGRTIVTNTLQKGTNKINFPNIASGTYFLTITKEEKPLHRQTIQIVQ